MRSLLNIIIAVFFLVGTLATNAFGQAASSNYATQTGNLGTIYSWIDCSAGTTIISGDDEQGSFSWPFAFSFYDNIYNTANSLSVTTNGFIRLDGTASTNYNNASSYTLSSSSTELGQIIATSVYDSYVGRTGSSWVKYLVTGSAPNRILTVEYNDIEIAYNDGRYADVQVSFYETTNKVVLKLGADNINVAGVDMGIHSGVSGYFDKWQEVASGTNNAWIEYTPTSTPTPPTGPAASWNYNTLTGNLGTSYSWINCTSSNIVSGDDAQATTSWPFNFNFYDNSYTTADNLSLSTNGFIRLDGSAGTNYSAASAYTLSGGSTELGQIIGMGVYDGKVGDGGGWVRSSVTGTAPNRIFTIEYNNLEINYNAKKYASTQVSFYETLNKIVLKFGDDNVNQAGADIGIHSGVSGYFNKWQEVANGTNNTWIEYTPPYIELNATSGSLLAYYPTLKTAFDKINDGTHRGNITIKIKNSTTETASAVLNASGAGSANYASVKIYPTVTGISINGDLAAALIDLNGADNVTIDGRVNATGTTKSLNIINSNTASSSTIRFVNGATNNTVKYCTIKGSETLATSGVLFFSDSNAGGGNNTNTIDNNNITNASNNSRPVNAVYSLGTGGKENSGNIISNNAIYDFIKHGTTSNGIFLSSNTTSWTIDGNSFYETTSFVPTAVATYNAININNTTGNSFTVANNYIGGSTALCGGSPWTKTNSNNNIFNAISLSVGSTAASSIQNNTIKNFSWGNSANAVWKGIEIIGGNVNIGTATGNTIGSATGTGSITVTGSTTGQTVNGIDILGAGTVDCQKNTIGSITVDNAAALAGNIYGISKAATAGTTTISNNFIGSTVTANSINASSVSSANAQLVYGVYNAGTGTILISNNTISKLKNGTTNATVGTQGVINGITSLNGVNTISNNIIYDLTISNANTNSTNSASVCGIALTGTSATKIITGNTIYNLSNTFASFAGHVIGVYYGGSTAGTNSVSENFIHSLSITGASSVAGSIYGVKIASGVTTYSNNIIILGGNSKTTIYGIYETGAAGNNNNIYFNTVYISGNLVSGSSNKSYALFCNASTNNRNFRNNIFMNARSTVAGANLHYAAYFNASGGTFTIDYNDYFVSGTGGVLGYYGANKTALPIVAGGDVNSLAVNPIFKVAGSTIFSDYYAASTLAGFWGTGVLLDYEGITRNNPPKMGALESSLGFIWQGNTSSDFATATNWLNGAVPLNGADISFAATPANDCFLDSNRKLKIITNSSSKKLVLNGKELTITGSIASATANQIDATSASSAIIFEGTVAQNLSSGIFVGNSINSLRLNNSFGLNQSGNITVSTALSIINGAYSIGANTLTINGSITVTSGTLLGGSTSNIVIGGSGASTSLPSVSLKNLTINRANGISLSGNLLVNGLLTLTSGTLNVGPNTLTIAGNNISRTNGNINSADPNGLVVFSNANGITLPIAIFNGYAISNLTINGTGGLTFNENITLNGILNLASANPSPTKGLLDMTDPFELIMGADATNDGGGDVTGIITRTTVLDNQTYTFGNKNTWLSFYSGATSLPDYMKLKVVIGNDPWGTGTVKRVYELIQANGNNYLATFRAFYLDSELNGNAEDELSFWAATFPFNAPVDNARSNFNATENWVEISDFDLDYLPSTFGVFQISMDESNLSYQTWTGRIDSDWNKPNNWAVAPFSGTVPTPASFVVIPDAATTDNDPTLPAGVTTELMTISLKSGSILNAGDNAQLSLNHNIGTWNNAGGTFNPGNSTVNFIYAGNTTISGTTTFNNVFIGETTSVNMTASSYIKIAGGITINKVGLNSGEFRTKESGATTVEYNGANQIITNPINSSGNNGYYKLVLSGSGIKTMPVTAMTIADEFLLEGPLTATAQSALSIGNELEILGGATFAAGAYDHMVGGNFDVGGHLDAGTFIPTAGKTITLNGAAVQNIYGGSGINFENLAINNSAGVDIFTDIVVNDVLTLYNGNLNVGTTTLKLNGGIVKTSGFINVNTLSSLTFGGTTALTLPASLFFTPPSINNFTINRTGGVVAGSDITVNGILNLQSSNPSANIGTFDTGNNTLNMGAGATTSGIGDVTGKIKRTTILPNVEYTFGNKFSSVTFPNIGTLPTEITLKVSMGSAPGWKPDGIMRVYDISQIGGSGTSAIIKSHYLDSELNGNIETNLSFFGYIFPSLTMLDRGLTELNATENWLTLSNADFGNLPSAFGVIEHGFGVSTSDVITWDGSESTDWFDPNNWTPAFIPSIIKTAIIPDAATTPNDPLITANSTSNIKTLSIQLGGILNAGANSQLTVNGSSGAWNNIGTFNAGTGKVLFNHGIPSEIAYHCWKYRFL